MALTISIEILDLYIKFYLGMDNSSDAVLIKQGHCSSEIVCRFARSSDHFLRLRNKTISSDAESREEQDGGKHLFVRRTTAVLWAIL